MLFFSAHGQFILEKELTSMESFATEEERKQYDENFYRKLVGDKAFEAFKQREAQLEQEHKQYEGEEGKSEDLLAAAEDTEEQSDK